MSSANCVANARRGKTVAHTSTTWGHVSAGAFLFTAGAYAPQRSAPACSTSYDDAIRSNSALHHRPSPAGACGLHSTLRWATACRSCAPVFPARCQREQGTGRSSTPLARGADAAPPRQQDRARCPAQPPPAGPHPPPPWVPGCRLCWSGVATPRRAVPAPLPALSAPLGRPPPGAPAAGGARVHAPAGRVWPGVLPRPAWRGALPHSTPGPPPPPPPATPGGPPTPPPPQTPPAWQWARWPSAPPSGRFTPPLGGPQGRCHCLPGLVQQPRIVPLPCPAKGLHGPYGLGGDPVHRQPQRRDRLARQRRPQPLERGGRPFPLCTPLQQRAGDGVRGAPLLHQGRNILHRQVHLGRGLNPVHHAALLPCRIDGQHDTTFRNLVVVLGWASYPR